MRIFSPGSNPRLMFSCEFSFTLSYLGWGRVFESSPNSLAVSVGSDGFLILGGLFGLLDPCAYDLSLRASSGERSLELSLVGPLSMIRIGGVICSFTCSLTFYAPCPLGTIGSRVASRILF